MGQKNRNEPLPLMPDPKDRRIIVVASAAEVKRLSKKIDWRAVFSGKGTPFALGSMLALIPQALLICPSGLVSIIIAFISRKRKPLPYLVFDPITARKLFQFPMNHPVDGVTYACCDAQPNTYVPLASFHRYMFESKMSAFQELCANLGVKKCTVSSKESEKSKRSAKASAGFPTNAGTASAKADRSKEKRKTEEAEIFMEFPEPKTLPTRSDSGWLIGEPTWQMMQKLRLERELEKYLAEFCYTDEMGITVDVAAKISGIGLSIGGAFEKIHQVKWRFDVEFWPKPE